MKLLHPWRFIRDALNERRYSSDDAQFRLGFGWVLTRYYMDQHPVDMLAGVVSELWDCEEGPFVRGAIYGLDQIRVNQKREADPGRHLNIAKTPIKQG